MQKEKIELNKIADEHINQVYMLLNQVAIAQNETENPTKEEGEKFNVELNRLKKKIKEFEEEKTQPVKESPLDINKKEDGVLPLEEDVLQAEVKLGLLQMDEQKELDPINKWYAEELKKPDYKTRLDSINEERRMKEAVVKTKYKQERKNIVEPLKEKIKVARESELESVEEYNDWKKHYENKLAKNPDDAFAKGRLNDIEKNTVTFFKGMLGGSYLAQREDPNTKNQENLERSKNSLREIIDIETKYDKALIKIGEKSEHSIWYRELLGELAEKDAQDRLKNKKSSPENVLSGETQEESDVETFGQAELKQEIETIIKQFSSKLEEKGLKYQPPLEIIPQENGLEITATLKGDWKRGSPKFITTIESTPEGVLVAKNPELKANMLVSAFAPKDKIEEFANSIGEKVKAYIEEKEERKVERMDIENGKLKVSYKK